MVRSSTTPLAPELCVAIGSPSIDLAGASSLIRIGQAKDTIGKQVDGAIPGLAGAALVELLRAMENT